MTQSYVEWELDYENGLDPYDPYGKIRIIGDVGSLEDDCTYIDVFLEAFVDGIQLTEIGKTVRIAPLIEPNDIIFRFEPNSIHLSYGSQTAIISNRQKFATDLHESIKEFVEILDELAMHGEQEKCPLLKLRHYIS